MTTKEMLAHPFLACEDIPKTLSTEAYQTLLLSLSQIPSFKIEEPTTTLSKVKSVDKLRPEDFGRKKPELNLNLNQLNQA